MPQLKQKLCLNTKIIHLYGEESDSGCECSFYEMGRSKYGIKVYEDFQEALDSFNRQSKAHMHGVGPRVRNFLVIKRKDSIPYFGYETEKAARVQEHEEIWKKESEALRNKLIELDMDGDFHFANCGILHGKLVLVDFGNLCYDCSVNRVR